MFMICLRTKFTPLAEV